MSETSERGLLFIKVAKTESFEISEMKLNRFQKMHQVASTPKQPHRKQLMDDFIRLKQQDLQMSRFYQHLVRECIIQTGLDKRPDCLYKILTSDDVYGLKLIAKTAFRWCGVHRGDLKWRVSIVRQVIGEFTQEEDM